MNLYFLLFALISCVPVLIKKQILKQYSAMDVWLLFSLIAPFIIIPVVIYKAAVKKDKFTFFKKFIKDKKTMPIFIGFVALSLAIGYFKLYYLKKMDLSRYLPLFKSLRLIFTFLFAIYLIGEKRTTKEYIGFVFLITGILIMNGFKF